MLLVPWLVGLSWTWRTDGFQLAAVLVGFCWLVGYLWFYAASQFLRSGFKVRYRTATFSYGVAAAALGGCLLWLRPGWWSWGLVFVPAIVLVLLLSWQRRDRSLLAGLVTVAAAAMLPVLMGSDGIWELGERRLTGSLAAACFGYFGGTVFYVKTNLRERGSVPWLVVSALWHLALVPIGWLLPGIGGWALACFFLVLALRSVVVPLVWPMRGRRLSPKHLGFGEVAASLVLLVLLIG